ncbi:MAG: RsmB/NOP family class I SAM-dependent RNA methyltransferase [Polaromonas sp.]|jgi:16S rRNA (cytosine967-C5)-methyltransferase|nr:RsmB/NOP family class I SAM-dependent RNA methyltransferase [Polaromonas sp.]MBP6156404.1 RsmB/NOP family class I SAM-dependent RNA methyltransferase [Polaromonas sp.]MBP7114996.1 RsmB/NOP family class I SAM-dependent RNA methyltransferase [Polaromonas sp.]MBP7308595.1 RsmB/NOP family class I SAM-dependent RNA methyltransferase [Polaromonas sp.]MBP8874151.1 RsmB/NOP family class I SAM-dependent RNA methyltransferase [Polaromonas sp.]
MHPQIILEACTELVRLTLKFDHPTDAIVAKFFRDHRNFGPRERATLTDTVYNVLRNKLRYDHFAPSGSGGKERRLAILGFAAPRAFLEGAINDQELAWIKNIDTVKSHDLLDRHRHNMPEWLVKPLKEQLDNKPGAGFWQYVASLNDTPGLDLRVNMLTDKREEVAKELTKVAITAEPMPYSPWGLRVTGKTDLRNLSAYKRGAIEVQDEGSQLLALLVDAKRGEMVADFCAGAGGKTLALGAAMRNTGRLYAFDTSAHRLDALKPRLARSSLSNIHPAVIAHERDERIKRLAGKMDRVLVDAPCSGLGTLRRNPAIKWRLSPKDIEDMAKLQAAILQSASRLVKSGGRLVYATCSLLKEENEAIALQFSAANPDFKMLPVGEALTQLKVDNAETLCSGTGQEGSSGLEYLRLWPHIHGTDGFFAAVWQRK